MKDYKEVISSLEELEERDPNFEKDKVKFYLLRHILLTEIMIKL